MGGQVPISFDTVPSLTSQAGDCLPCSALRQMLTECGPCPATPGAQPSPVPSPTQPAQQPLTLQASQGGGQPVQLIPTNQPGVYQLAQPNAPAPTTVPYIGPDGQPYHVTPVPNQPGQYTLQKTTMCPAGEHPQPCAVGEGVDPQSGCCQAAPIETCIVCPGGLSEWEAGLAGQPNKCYVDHQAYLPLNAPLPAPDTSSM